VSGSWRLPEGVAGIGRFHELVASFGVEDPSEVVIGIETDRGLWVQSLVAAGYLVYAINPLSVSAYRDRYRVSGGKSDPGDARLLADVMRTDSHLHRRVVPDSELVQGLMVLTRSHQTLIWERTRHSNMLRSALRQFYPAALETFKDLTDRDAVAVLGRAPDPQSGARLSVTQIKAVLKKAGRQRNLDKKAAEIQTGLRSDQIRAVGQVESAYAVTTKASIRLITEINQQITVVADELEERFRQHPDTEILRSLPGLAVVLGARVLAEFGDAPNRYLDARSRRNYAGTSPITKESGKTRIVKARWVKKKRLTDAVMQWAFSAIRVSPGARALYDQQRAKGAGHHQALRSVANRLVAILHGCLKTRTLYNEDTAWAHRQPTPQTKAA